MKFFFEPRGIAVVGASPDRGKGGNIIVSNLKKGYPGKIFPVNPRYESIEGFACYSSVLDVPDPVDLAIVFVSAKMVAPVIEACAERGIPAVMIQSAGFSEIGSEGERLQNTVKEMAGKKGVRLWGPNCMGLVNTVNRHVFSTVTPSFWETGLISGGVSLIAQSGMLAGAFLIDIMSHGSMGIAKVCSIGNKMDVNENDLLEYLIDDPDTRSIGLYLESFYDCRRFMELARSTSKPIVVLNGGKTDLGAAAALSHTASLSANGAIIEGAMAQAGVAVANGFYQLADFCKTLAAYPGTVNKRNNRVAVLTYTGAAGIVSTDIMDTYGLKPADLRPETLRTLQTVFPEWMPPANPVDMWPGIILNGTDRTYGKAMEAVCADPGVDAVFAHCFVGGFNLEPDIAMMAETARRAGKPFFCWISGEREKVCRFQATAHELGVPVFREIIRAVECISLLLKREPDNPSKVQVVMDSRPLTIEQEKCSRLLSEGDGQLDEYVAKKIFAASGIPVVQERCVATMKEAVKAAAEIGYPLVVKGLVPGVSHKTESDLVRLGVTSVNDLESSLDSLQSSMKGCGRILIQKLVPGKIELTAGFIRDPLLGECVMCGLGGIFAETLNITAFGLAPLGQADALGLIDRLKCQSLLNGVRGLPPVKKDVLARILVVLGDLGCLYPRIQEIDINPLIINNNGSPIAVDGLVVLSKDEWWR